MNISVVYTFLTGASPCGAMHTKKLSVKIVDGFLPIKLNAESQKTLQFSMVRIASKLRNA